MKRLMTLFAAVVFLTLSTALVGCAKDEDEGTGGGGGGGGDGDGEGDSDTGSDGDTATEMFTACAECYDYRGVDILVVVDNSVSMAEEQQILATGFFTLINQLVAPTEDWEHEPASSVRVAVVSSDMGLQFGEDGQEPDIDLTKIASCEEPPKGDDGAFMTDTPESVVLESSQIQCDEGGNQCPTEDWPCVDGYCEAPDGAEVNGEFTCPTLAENAKWAFNKESGGLAGTVACMAQLGAEGCGVEQQLQAGVRSLTREDQTDFVRGGHLLAVIVVSDEEDCSIKSDGLFDSPEWNDQDLANTACNLPEENEKNFLFDVKHFRDELVAVKGGDEAAVMFAAIVGVPDGDDSPCQGLGDSIDDCLSDDRMQYEIEDFGEYKHFSPACERENDDGDVVTSARPGRRYVKLARRFGCLGYVYSICNAEWSDAMEDIARIIAACITVVV